jgi:outer membrane biosynthesis protein TonB
MNGGPAPLWRRLWPLAGAVLAAHLAMLQGGWHALVPTRDRWVQHFTTRTISVARPSEAPPPPATPPQTVAAAPVPRAEKKPASVREPRAQVPAAREQPAPAIDAAPPPAPAPAPPEQGAQAQSPEQRPSPDPGSVAPDTAVTPFTPTALGVPQPSVMRYEVTLRSRGFSVQGEARLDWWHNGQQYDLRLELTVPGARERVQHSAGQITEEGLAPDRFSDKSRGEQATHFDRVQQRLVFSNNRPDAALAAGMQDRLSVVVQLAMLVAGEPARFAPGTRIAIPTASTREAEDWLFRVEGEEELDLPGGRLRALKLERLPRREFDQKVELWLAPGRDYAPVRLRLTNPDGGTVDQRWASTDRG